MQVNKLGSYKLLCNNSSNNNNKNLNYILLFYLTSENVIKLILMKKILALPILSVDWYFNKFIIFIYYLKYNNIIY